MELYHYSPIFVHGMHGDKFICNIVINLRTVLNVHSKYKEDRQSNHSVTLRRVRSNVVAVEKQYVLHILSVYL
jgi:hypothetical protein